jgi:hypothetical protein
LLRSAKQLLTHWIPNPASVDFKLAATLIAHLLCHIGPVLNL